LAQKQNKKDKERSLKRQKLPRLNKRKITEIKHGLSPKSAFL
jgi:hypothetical protein